METRHLLTVFLSIATAVAVADGDYASAQKKFDQIEAGTLRAGSRVVFSAQELTSWSAQEVPTGVRNPKVELGTGTATGSALIDFGKLRRGQGHPPGWLMSKLLDGERPVRVTVRIRSSNGKATVDVERVEISGVQIDGQTLNFMIQNFLLALYPDAIVGQPFEIGSRVDRIEVTPAVATVVIGK